MSKKRKKKPVDLSKKHSPRSNFMKKYFGYMVCPPKNKKGKKGCEPTIRKMRSKEALANIKDPEKVIGSNAWDYE